jgi:hypothetical protein
LRPNAQEILAVNGSKNLIMGLLSGMTFGQVETFLASLRYTGFGGDVCMFVARTTPDTVDALLAHGVLVERADNLPLPSMGDQASRYFAYLNFLTRSAEVYANVMVSDLRDVVFQSDPFERPLPADIVFAQERCRIGEDPVNRNWIAAAYGNAVADSLRDFTVSCSGTTFGTSAGMLRYLVAMTTELSAMAAGDLLQIRGIDQGIHNYLIRMRPLRQAWLDPTDSIVATMHFVHDGSVRTSAEGLLIDGRLVPVLHQWDRNVVSCEYVGRAQQFKLGTAPQTRRSAEPASACSARRR